MTTRKISNFYCFLLFIIGLVSCIDGVINVVHRVHDGVEENPLARAILIASNNNIVPLMTAKAIGTIFVLAFLRFYYYYNLRQAYIVAFVLASLQVVFLCYIMMG